MPWNPMRVEQRIGRIHRLGQQHDVSIYNFSTLNTIEEHIIWLLQEKIQLFETVIGELETILEKMEDESLEHNLMRIMLETHDEAQIRQHLDRWGDTFHQVRHAVTIENEAKEELLRYEPTTN
jgi:hypothetical protein